MKPVPSRLLPMKLLPCVAKLPRKVGAFHAARRIARLSAINVFFERD